MNKVYRVVIDEDLNSVDRSVYMAYVDRYSSPYYVSKGLQPEDFIPWVTKYLNSAKAEAFKRTYSTAAAARGILTRIKNSYKVNGWVEEGTVEWTKI